MGKTLTTLIRMLNQMVTERMPGLKPPESIFCPKCGRRMSLEKIKDPETMDKLEDGDYSQGARGTCKCGVVAILAIKEMPKEPTFTLMFNIYQTPK